MNRIITLFIITMALFAFGCSQMSVQPKNEGYQVTDSRNVTLHFKQKPQRKKKNSADSRKVTGIYS